MRIVHVIGSCSVGGAEIFVKSLLISLNKLKEIESIELWVMTRIKDISPNDKQKLDFEKNYVQELTEAGISVRFINKRPRKDWLKVKRELKELYIQFKPHIIHSHLESVTFHTCRGLSKYNTSIVQTIHSTVINYHLLQKYYIKRKIKGYVAISEEVRKNIINLLKVSNKNTYLIYNGVNLDKFKLFKRNLEKIPMNIIAIGRLTKAKNYENLLTAFKYLLDKLNNNGSMLPKLNIVGDGELRETLIQLVSDLKIANYVEFYGSRNDIPNLLAKSDIYVMSSEWEGLSISLIEAVASGIPIVATDAGSNYEIIENEINGLLVPIKQPVLLANAIYRLLEDPRLRTVLSNNCSSKINKFEIDSVSKSHLSMYQEVLKSFE